ncbi:hypothetical protein [uncultured Clostridium sp.]|nr:hypothetical protein [uncultured Clostridium sp.]
MSKNVMNKRIQVLKRNHEVRNSAMEMGMTVLVIVPLLVLANIIY